MRNANLVFKKLLGAQWDCLEAAATETDHLEARYRRRFQDLFAKYNEALLQGQEPDTQEITDLLIRHYFETSIMAWRYAETEKDLITKPKMRFAKPPATKLPKSLKELMKLYDKYRKTGETSSKTAKRAKEIADRVRESYLKRIASIYKRYGAQWQGDAWTFGDLDAKARATKALERASKASYARSKMIVETETTNYVNKARKDYYDASPDVEAYLFLAVRDAATTKWCKSRTGKWFHKHEAVADICTPPIHYNCRSEIVPLSPLNPVHKRILADNSRHATQSNVEPLPKGWGKR
jgi:SPP1 gp7 family putative phage head morphogenesis protein